MKRKSLLFGLLAVLSAVLIFTGCANPADGANGAPGASGVGTEGPEGPGGWNGDISVAALQSLINSAVSRDFPVILDNVELTDTGKVDLKTAKVEIVGTLTTSGSGNVIDARNAAIQDTDYAVDLAGANDYLIAPQAVGAKVTGDSLGKYAEPADGIPPSPDPGTVIAMEDYTLTTTAIPANLTLLVYGELTVPGTAAGVAPTGKIVATNSVNLTDDNTVALASGTVDISYATVTSTKAVSVKLPATVDTAFDLQYDITLDSQTTSLAAGLKGEGTLKVGGAVTAVTTTGTGKIEFTKTTFASLGASTFGNTGATTFGGAVTTVGNITFAGPVTFSTATGLLTLGANCNAVFGGNVTLAGGIKSGTGTSAIAFNGNVTLGDTKAITIGNTSGAVTLKAGKSILVGTTPLLTAVTDTAITANTADATLTVAVAKSLTVAAQAITVGGKAAVKEALVLTTGITLDTGAVLTIADPSKVSGSGVIKSDVGTITIGEGDEAVEGFTTTSTGVAGDDLGDALAAFETDVVALTTYIALADDFGDDPGDAIGTVAPTTIATVVTEDDDGGNSEAEISIDADSTLEGTLTSSTYTLTVDGGKLKIADSDYESNGSISYVILTFTGLQLKNSELISPAVEDFSIGVKQER
jgi:hypothetical protein